jgi:alkylhydroperoxidase/carboxymuconolactone decarboxylase family protein YurZ
MQIWTVAVPIVAHAERKVSQSVAGGFAFYAGWPNVFSALPVVKDVCEQCSN